MTGFDLVSMGRTGVDIYPLDHGVGLEDVQTFEKFLGGSATNVAVAAARYGRRSALVTRTGQDPFGRYVRREARAARRRPRLHHGRSTGPPTPVTFCEVFPPDDFPLYFYRYPTAPDLHDRRRTTCRWTRSVTPAVFWATVTGLSQEPSRAAHFAAWEARGRRRAHRPRPRLPADVLGRPARGHRAGRQGARARHRRRRQPRGVRGRRRRDRPAACRRRPARARRRARGRQAGPQGRARRDRATSGSRCRPSRSRSSTASAPATPSAAPSCHGLLAGWDLRRILEFANVAGAIVAGTPRVLHRHAGRGRGRAAPLAGRHRCETETP